VPPEKNKSLHPLNSIHLTHYSNDLLNTVSNDIANHAQHLLPDLSAVTVFLPNLLIQNQLRSKILHACNDVGYSAVLPPNITTLKRWVCSQYEINKPVLSQYARELILVDAIKQQPELFSDANPWTIADELLNLFDAMELNNIQPATIKNHINKKDNTISHALLHESDLVKTLWEAWQEQIIGENYLDPTQLYAQALKNTDIDKAQSIYCVGLDQFSNLESDFLDSINHQSNIQVYAYACNSTCTNRTDHWLMKYQAEDNHHCFENADTINSYSTLLDSVYTTSNSTIKQRAERFIKDHPDDPVLNRLQTYKTNSFEAHTKALDLQIRIWINEDKNNIGVVTTDRKLVRRLRAILEHANVAVNDAAGWALATTSAAVVIEWWLQLVEERFPAKIFLALANSPFFPTSDDEIHRQALDYFEKHIILDLNLHNGMNHFRSSLEQTKTIAEDSKILDYLYDLLDKFEQSAQLLGKLHGSKNYPLHYFISELLNSLKPIGLYTALNKDDAGKQIITLFEDQISHFKLVDNSMSWSESRRFLSRIFDQQNYKPPISKSCVTFCSLEQSRLQNFDALVIASVDKNNFPGNINNYVFFNEQVRSELDIPTWRDDHARYLHQFRCLLEAAKTILITVQTEKYGEKTSPSPWLEAIEAFYRIAYNNELTNQKITDLVALDGSTVSRPSQLPLPTHTVQPEPILLPNIKPKSITISEYQSLVDCPYQYFALSCLNLSQTKELSEDLDKADFGSLIHKCVHAFYNDLPNLPGPFKQKITTTSKNAAEELLIEISQTVFSKAFNPEPTTNFNNELWLQRWLNLIPKFIDWEVERQSSYTPLRHEKKFDYEINKHANINGRVDRVDRCAEGLAIIDYKTGVSATRKSILAGEQVQLPMYALLNTSVNNEPVTRVEYLDIGKDNKVKSSAIVKKDDLDELKDEHLQRIQEFFTNISQDLAFTAHGSDDICEKCNAVGVCRKVYWQN